MKPHNNPTPFRQYLYDALARDDEEGTAHTWSDAFDYRDDLEYDPSWAPTPWYPTVAFCQECDTEMKERDRLYCVGCVTAIADDVEILIDLEEAA